jgi:hypothetical protein
VRVLSGDGGEKGCKGVGADVAPTPGDGFHFPEDELANGGAA